MNSVKSNNQSLKYQRFTTSGSKDIGVFDFVTKTQFLYLKDILKNLKNPAYELLLIKLCRNLL